MRVLIHTHATAGNRTGVGHYTIELLKALGDERGVRVFEYPSPRLARFRRATTRG